MPYINRYCAGASYVLLVRMLHVVNEVIIDTCDIHQIKENAEVKPKK